MKDESLGYALHYATRMAMAILQERLEQHGVAVGQFPVLIHLLREDGITQKELRELVRVEQPTLANTLKRMERDGLITRTPDEEDGRQSQIHLTRKARGLREDLLEASRHGNRILAGGMSAAELKEFKRLLGIVITTLEDKLSEKGGTR